MIKKFAENIWIVEGHDIKFFGIPFEIRMTIIKLADGSLWLHSPVQPSDELFQAVGELGEVSHIIAPNKLHHLYVKPWAEKFTKAKLWAAPGLMERKLGINFDEKLDEHAPPEWTSDIDQIIFHGSKILAEAIFFHKNSRTLIVTDLIQNHSPEKNSWFWRQLKRLGGVLAPKGGVPIDLRLTILDRQAGAKSFEQILKWDFDRLIIAHGLCLSSQARPFVEKAFSWIR